MYLISLSPQLQMPIRNQSTDYAGNGAVLRVNRSLAVRFHPSPGAPDWAKEAVSKLAAFGRGIGHNEDPYSRIGVLDTDEEAILQQWSSEEKKYVEDALMRSSSCGVSYAVCQPPKVRRPWDSYDEFVGDDAVAKILYTIDLTGADPKQVLRYERENANRDDVVEAIEAIIEKEEEDVVGVIQV